MAKIFISSIRLIGSCSNSVIRFKFICNKCQCLLFICFTFGNVLLCYDKIYSFDSGASNASLSISDNRWNIVSTIFSLKPQFINDFFNTCRFFESSEVSVQIFFQAKSLAIWYNLYQWSRMSRGIV